MCQIEISLWYVRQPTNLMGYKHVCNTEGPGFDSSLIHIRRPHFSILKNSNFSFLTCYRDACGYIKKAYIVDNAINTR